MINRPGLLVLLLLAFILVLSSKFHERITLLRFIKKNRNILESKSDFEQFSRIGLSSKLKSESHLKPPAYFSPTKSLKTSFKKQPRKPTSKPTSKSTTKPRLKPTSKQTTKPTTESITKPTSKSTSKPTSKSTTKPRLKSTLTKTTEPTTESTSKPTSNPTPNLPSLSNTTKSRTCNNLENGHWSNFQRHGFWHRFDINVESGNITKTEDPKLDSIFYNEISKPRYSNGFYKWADQNYTATWEPECKKSRKANEQTSKCMQRLMKNFKEYDSAPTIAINGDSISRQIYLGLSKYLGQKSGRQNPDIQPGNLDAFIDTGFQHGKYMKNMPNLAFYWNDGVTVKDMLITYPNRTRFEQKITENYTETEINNQLEQDMFNLKPSKNRKMLIIGPKFLHQLAKIRPKFLTEKSVFITTVVCATYFKKVELENIKNYLITNPTSKIYVLAQHFVHRHQNTSLLMKAIQDYNEKVKQAIFLENDDRIKFVGVIEKLSMDPEGKTLLAVDGTHWMWTSKRMRLQYNLPISPNHLALFDLIFDDFCTK